MNNWPQAMLSWRNSINFLINGYGYSAFLNLCKNGLKATCLVPMMYAIIHSLFNKKNNA